MKITSIILAAGKGTRMKNNIPKVLNECSGRTLLEHVILAQQKISSSVKVIANSTLLTSPLYKKLEQQYSLESIIQPQQLGTADAVKHALPISDPWTLVLCGDIPLLTESSLLALCENSTDLTLLAFKADNPEGYGRVVTDGKKVKEIVEEKDANTHIKSIDLCNTGVMLIATSILEKIITQIDNNNSAGEFYLTDLIKLAVQAEYKVTYVLADQQEAMGVNDLEQLALVDAIMQRRIKQGLQLQGIRLIDPDSIYIYADANIASQVTIYPQVFIGSQVKLHPEVIVHSFSHLQGVEAFSRVQIGPFARLRPGTVLHEEVKIGNFVEVKNSIIEAGAKASHLTYIGDAEIGKEVNIGAGTIFCNYDGKRKHRSEVGEQTMIGSNTAIISPVKIGKHSTIGAGSTITKDVPDYTLAIARSSQSNLPKKRYGMMELFLTNTLTGKKEKFVPLDYSNIRMYVCGPTVYDRPHLGNARAAVVYDLLYRILLHLYPKVTYVRNITDVDDKIITAAHANGEAINALTTRITEFYHQDIAALNCLSPSIEPLATKHISQMIAMIEQLIASGHAYYQEQHVLFSVESFADYGALAGRSAEEMIAGSRVEVAPFKRNPADFVLWKPAKEGEENASFQSPWGVGRPGWHIECSAMSKQHLGEVFDIHGGGADLMFPHHENEVAQSRCANNTSSFAQYWVHNGFLLVGGEKMSKSLGNFKTVRQELERGVEAAAIRYLYFSAHYRKPLDYNVKALQDANKALNKFRAVLEMYSASQEIPEVPTEILEHLADDMNTPKVLSALHHFADEGTKGNIIAIKKLRGGLEFLGLAVNIKEEIIPLEVLKLADARKAAKLEKNWELADSLRQQALALGYVIKDSKDGGYAVQKKDIFSEVPLLPTTDRS